MQNPETVIESVWPKLSQLRYHRVCLAVSGGADSTALLCSFARLAQQYKLSAQLVVGHVNHGVRGTESDGDALFVRQTAEQYHLVFEERRIQAWQLEEAVQRTGSWENAARELRYQLLMEMALKHGARYIAAAHTKNDQLETILQRLFRGTGIDGLCAIPRIRPLDESVVLIRPLLDLDREDIESYLKMLRQTYRNDSSNQTNAYLRNRIRHELTPVLEQLFPGRWRNSLLRLSQLAEEITREDLSHFEQIHHKAIKKQTENELVIDLTELKKLNSFVLSNFLRFLWKEQKWHLGEMGRNQWQRLCRLVQMPEPSTKQKTSVKQEEFPGSITVKKNDSVLYICQTNNIYRTTDTALISEFISDEQE